MYPPPVAYANAGYSTRGPTFAERLALQPTRNKVLLLLAAGGFVLWVVSPGGASSSAQTAGSFSLRPATAAGVGPDSRRISLNMWSHTFGRNLHDGEGELCDYNSHLARTSSHALLNVAGRDEFGTYMDQLGAEGYGVELGVQRAEFSYGMMTGWTNVTKYYLVDPWAHQADYVDGANRDQDEQETIYAEAKERMAEFGKRVAFIRDYSTKAVEKFPDCYFDWVYVDAVHDYEGALNDMIDWWPKVRPGGVMAGHDYLDAILPPDVIFGSKSAADRFAVAVNRPLHVTQNDGDYPSFWIIK